MTGRGLLFVAVWLLAQPSLAAEKGDARGIAVEAVNPLPPFMVRVEVNRSDRLYRDGDVLTASVRSQRRGYLYLFYCDASGGVSCIFPNDIQKDNQIKADVLVRVPDERSRFRFRIQKPFGKEVLKAVVTAKPLSELDLRRLTAGKVALLSLKQFEAVFAGKGIRQSVQEGGRRPVAAKPAEELCATWAEHHVEITTQAGDARPPMLVGLDRKPVAAPARPRRVGVFIGISRYADRRIRKLRVAHRDAAEVAKVMQDVGKLDEVAVLSDDKATLAAIEELIRVRLPAATRPGDLAVIYWSGHGGRTTDDEGKTKGSQIEYLVPYDGKLGTPATLRRTMLLDRTFGRWVQALDGRQVVVVLDACYSAGQAGSSKGVGGEEDVPLQGFFEQGMAYLKDIGQKEVAVLASSKASELSFERREADLSVLTYFLTRRLRTGKERLSLKEVFAAVEKEVPAYVSKEYPGKKQTPVLIDQTTPPVYLRP